MPLRLHKVIACLLGAFAVGVWPTMAADGTLELVPKASEGPNAPAEPKLKLYGASKALVIGIDAYGGSGWFAKGSGWPKLSMAVKDAEEIAKALTAKGFAVTLKKDLTSTDLDQAFRQFLIGDGADPEARLLVWFAGHGHTISGEGYLVAADAPDPDASDIEFRSKALSLRRFGEYMREARAKHVLAVFDSCFGGSIFNVARARPPRAITLATAQTVRQFISSGDSNQVVSDNGAFRRLFIDAIEGRERDADANGDGYITGTELGLFVSDKVTNYSEKGQTPRYGKLNAQGYDLGDFVLEQGKLTALPSSITTAAPPTGGSTTTQSEVERAWGLVQASDNVAVLEAFRKQYGAGNALYDQLAANRIAALVPAEEKSKAKEAEPAKAKRNEKQRLAMLAGKEERKGKETQEAPPNTVANPTTSKTLSDKKHAAIAPIAPTTSNALSRPKGRKLTIPVRIGERESRGSLGTHIASIDETSVASLDLPVRTGAWVTKTPTGGPAHAAGVLPGDVIISYDGRTLSEAQDLVRMVSATPPNQIVPLEIWRVGNGAADLAQLLRSKADAGDTGAIRSLGVAYSTDLFGKPDDAEAVRWYRKAAEAGDAAAMSNLGSSYAEGRGVAKDDMEAVHWYRKGAEAGDAMAMSDLGFMYSEGRGVAKDDAEAVRWYRKGAEAGSATAMSDLAFRYAQGWGVAKDEAEAVRWYRKGAEAGSATAMSDLASKYVEGRGVAKDDTEAVRWYRKGAEAGSAAAMTGVGFMYAEGRGVAKDETEAVRWYRKGAEAGDVTGMRNLAFMYAEGRGVAKDDAEAARWQQKAAEAEGDARAAAFDTFFGSDRWRTGNTEKGR